MQRVDAPPARLALGPDHAPPVLAVMVLVRVAAGAGRGLLVAVVVVAWVLGQVVVVVAVPKARESRVGRGRGRVGRVEHGIVVLLLLHAREHAVLDQARVDIDGGK